MTKTTFFLFHLGCIIFYLTVSSASREKRYLVYSQNGSKLQLIFGTGVPIPALEHISATIGWIIKYTMPVPTNATQYTDPLAILGNDDMRNLNFPKIDRFELYDVFERKFLKTHLAGRDCLLRTICDVARVPFKGSGLIGKLLNIFLTPSATNEKPAVATDGEYHRAELLGREGESSCEEYYPDCKINLHEIMSVIT